MGMQATLELIRNRLQPNMNDPDQPWYVKTWYINDPMIYDLRDMPAAVVIPQGESRENLYVYEDVEIDSLSIFFFPVPIEQVEGAPATSREAVAMVDRATMQLRDVPTLIHLDPTNELVDGQVTGSIFRQAGYTRGDSLHSAELQFTALRRAPLEIIMASGDRRSGLRALRQIQIGQESAPGTAVPPSAMLVGRMDMSLNQEIYMPNDLETGRLASFERSEPIARQVALSFESDANYEQLPYFLDMAIKQAQSTDIVKDGDGSAADLTGDNSRWIYKPNISTPNAPRAYTMRYGDNIDVYETAFVGCNSLSFNGQVGDVVRMSAGLFGQTITRGNSFVSSLNLPELEAIKMSTCQFFVGEGWTGTDSLDAAVTANEPIESALIDFQWQLNTGFTPVKFADNRLHFTEITEAKRHVELSMTVGFSERTNLWFQRFVDQAKEQAIEIRFTGSKLAPETRFKTLKLRSIGRFTEYSGLSEREGQDIVKIKHVSSLDSIATAADIRDFEVIIDTSIDELP